MKTAIMQPYLFPYIGYFQLINEADQFIIYDNIQFTKKGWINRNRILVNHTDEYITVPLKKGSDYLNVNERFLSDNFAAEAQKLLRKLEGAYRKTPFFDLFFPVLKSTIECREDNLFKYIFNSLQQLCTYLGITTKFIQSSEIPIDHNLKAADKVIALCLATDTDVYINPIGGLELYAAEHFKEHGIQLHFIKSNELIYDQYGGIFVPWLSIIDICMFNSKEQVQQYLKNYRIV